MAVSLARSAEVISAPGNAGTALVGANHDVDVGDVDGLVALAHRLRVDLVVPGPEAPLVAGIADACAAAGIACAGPSTAAARLEASKAFARELAESAGVPGPLWEQFTTVDDAVAFVRRRGAPIVVKADGLAGGKGVVVAATVDEAEMAIRRLGAPLVIEDRLEGDEVSLFALCDGTDALLLGAAQDHKRLGDGDTGPNTGGMGAVTPPAGFGRAAQHAALHGFVLPVLGEMARRKTPYRGVLFAGLMITSGGLRLIEYNVRLGDPEAQCLLPLLRSDLAAALMACATGRLGDAPWQLADEASAAIVLAAPGYPDTPRASVPAGIAAAESMPLVHVFRGGAGRVLTVQASGPDLSLARDAAYAGVAKIDWPEAVFRRDIGARSLR